MPRSDVPRLHSTTIGTYVDHGSISYKTNINERFNERDLILNLRYIIVTALLYKLSVRISHCHKRMTPTAADQVGKISDSYNLTITREIPDRFKSALGYKANNSYLESFQTSSESSPKLLGLVRTIQVKERPTSKYQPPYVFKPKESVPMKRLASRPNWFKLAYAGNIKDKDREGFGIKSGKKTKDCSRKTNYAFWNAYMFVIICITGNLIYFRNLVNTWQPTAFLNHMRKLK